MQINEYIVQERLALIGRIPAEAPYVDIYYCPHEYNNLRQMSDEDHLVIPLQCSQSIPRMCLTIINASQSLGVG